MLIEILNHSITVAVVILSVIILRIVFGNHISPAFRYALWILVVLKLFIPLSFIESEYGLNNLVERGTSLFQSVYDEESSYLTQETENPYEIIMPVGASTDHNGKINENSFSIGNAASIGNEIENISEDSLFSNDQEWKQPWNHSEMITEIVIFGVWLVGVFVLAVLMLSCNIHMYWKIKKTRILLESKDFPLKVYISDQVQVPCLFGFFRPAVYLTDECMTDEKMTKQILTHEYVHYKQKDHIWSMVRSLSLILYWYHPMVWAAVRLSGTDSELSCDWKTIRLLGEENRADYGRTLIKISCENYNRKNLFMCATGILNDAKELKKRLKILVNKTKKSLTMAVMVVFFSICLGVFTFAEDAEITLMEIPEYPLTEESITNALAEVGLKWNVVQESADQEDTTLYSMYTENDQMIAGLLSAGNKNERVLTISTFNSMADAYVEGSMMAAVTGEDEERLLHLAAILYGGLENAEQIAKDYDENFTEKSMLEKQENAADSGNVSMNRQYAYKGKWNSIYDDIKCQINVGQMEEDETDILSLGIYNSGKYIPFNEAMDEDEVFVPAPELSISEITKWDFTVGYEKCIYYKNYEMIHDDQAGEYRYFEVVLKESSYAPDYPFELEFYIAVNTSIHENNIDYAYRFINQSDFYSFNDENILSDMTLGTNADGTMKLDGWIRIAQLMLMDESGEIVQKKTFGYHGTFEIPVSKESALSDDEDESLPRDILSLWEETIFEVMENGYDYFPAHAHYLNKDPLMNDYDNSIYVAFLSADNSGEQEFRDILVSKIFRKFKNVQTIFMSRMETENPENMQSDENVTTIYSRYDRDTFTGEL